jgi:hypothetical protein
MRLSSGENLFNCLVNVNDTSEASIIGVHENSEAGITNVTEYCTMSLK